MICWAEVYVDTSEYLSVDTSEYLSALRPLHIVLTSQCSNVAP